MSLPLLSVNFVDFGFRFLIGTIASTPAGTSGFGTTAITQLHTVLVVPWN
jgi:hypothetical protein